MDTQISLLKESFELSATAFLILDSVGNLYYTNDTAKQLLKKNKKYFNFNNTTLFDFIEKQNYFKAPKIKKFLNSTTNSIQEEIHFNPEQNIDSWFSIRARRLTNNYIFCEILDITKEKTHQNFLDAQRISAEQATSSKSRFLANMSHEIRTPIQTIIGTIALLSDTNMNQEQLEYTRQIRFGADVLLSLVNDILDFSKIEAGQLNLEHISFDLHQQIYQTLAMIALEANKKGIEILLDIESNVPRIIKGDPWRLQQIILNLIKNAVKFTTQGHILVKTTMTNDEKLLIEVKDTGIGISKNNQAQIFTSFYQGDTSTTRKFGGTGLGLSISKNLVLLMNGNIGSKPNTPCGSVFWFSIPVQESVPENDIPTITLHTEKKVLIVDDYEPAAENLYKMICRFGFTQVKYITTAKDVLEEMRKKANLNTPYDLVFIDLQMPEVDGWHLAAEITNDKTINKAALYLMVPEGAFGSEAKMKLLPWFNDYLYKPISKSTLERILQKNDSIDMELPLADEDSQITEKNNSNLAKKIAINKKTNTLQESQIKKEEHLAGEGLKILLAEDHPVNQKLLKIMLEKAGCETVITANNGEDAINQVKKQTKPFDIIFMDIQMPIMNGYEATKEIRKLNFKNPVIACTASGLQDEKDSYFTNGMNDVLIKPFKKNDVLTILKKWRSKI